MTKIFAIASRDTKECIIDAYGLIRVYKITAVANITASMNLGRRNARAKGASSWDQTRDVEGNYYGIN